MPIIGVDSSGVVKDPPIYMVAVRLSKKKGQVERTIRVTSKKHEEYIQYIKKIKVSHSFEKISASLIFKTIFCKRGIYFAYDSINIDVDFQGKSRDYVKKYLKSAVPADKRLRIAKFLQNWIAGMHGVGTWHGAGAAQAQMLTLYRITNFEEKKKLAMELAGIKD